MANMRMRDTTGFEVLVRADGTGTDADPYIPYVNAAGAGAGGASTVTGNVASGVADTGNPVKVGGIANAAAPAAVSTGQRINAWYSLTGTAMVTLANGSGNQVGVGTPPADGNTGASNGAYVNAFPELFNGSTWDRPRGNVDATLLASAARTTTTASADQVNYNGRGVQVFLNVTAASGTGGLQVQVQFKDPVSGNYASLNATPTAVTTTGQTVYEVYPGDGAASGGVTQRTSGVLPRTWRVNVIHGDASSYTYSVGASVIR